ncbi:MULTISPECIES: hydroxymethylbilane synthase [Actinomadura]|uniref:Porphobilinogen deaminase n=1 Tax=Actinomadura yumaensis TaxID=111807 RepID=A0ABW2CKE4_9ACTN|nr:hydroxymethylbilane synthase [Actinomadura sp. J1-007]MWK37036.1 hydroxymethylbilane synthase [Actinomadura sp. J1-007]
MTTNAHDARPLLLGTRRSKLAVAQATWAADRVTAATGRAVRLVPLSTEGDESDAPIERFGSTGVFVTALRKALLAGEVDFVVHSCKDLPTAPEAALRLAAVPAREDPRDALAGPAGLPGSLDALPPGAAVGTGSPRRAAQILARAPHVAVVPLRGNVDSRLARTATGELDAVVLAMAGLSRLGRLGEVAAPLRPDIVLPAPGQGALAIECRADDPATASVLATADDPPTRLAVTAERAFLAGLDAGCTSPVGALATPANARGLRLDGLVAAPDGSTVLRSAATATVETRAEATALGERLARALLADGGAALLTTPAGTAAADPRTRPDRPARASQPLGRG